LPPDDIENKYITTGVWTRLNTTTIEITELPIGKWTQSYKEFLDSLVESNEIIDYKNNSDDLLIDFKITLQKSVLDRMISDSEITKKFKLTTYLNTSNMHVFDAECKIRKMSSPEEIIFRFYKVRISHFHKRKEYLLGIISKDLEILESKIKFIQMVIAEKIIVFNKKKEFIIEQIKKQELIKINDSWDYLLDMKIWTLTYEKIESMITQQKKLKEEMKIIKSTTVEQMWNSELMSLEF
jgi:DNA topoisomerase-2